ncbi:SDR family NAD(P)-dependent oxidoreductase [Nocardia sp. CA-107356]|uniref:SDR family NAD(P)-dependent oxidoreductase n=1 Tax=Nocardia sp. CA-107356 TaxID=3239972 RepID=UPI003D8F4C46
MDADFADRRLARTPIAIVGMSGLFPMARTHREYWQNVFVGTDCTQDVPESRWSVTDYYDPDPAARDKTYSRRGGFLPNIEFDPVEFGLPPNQLGITSTMQLLSLGVARDLLLDAGAPGSTWYAPSRTGVVLGTTGAVPLTHPLAARLSTPVLKEVVRSCGMSARDADEIANRYVTAFAPWEENTFPGLEFNVVAGRVANRLGLGGMNCTVDAACAASLAAIRVAVAELVDGRADMMITGGVDTDTSIFMYMCFSKVEALSHSDRISPFAASADGTLLGEGIGMLGLKRLGDAERDGNRIYAVLRGIGSSSDGRGASIYAPRAEGQRVALDRAYADADCSPGSVELFEAHATGTAVGDRTELSALGDLLRAASDEPRFAALGSVKSQIGHTKGTAGTAGLMKLAFALHQKVLPGTINVEEPNSALDSADAPFYVNRWTRPWILDPDRPVRRAAVSSMGFGGTNFHFVLEEHRTDRTGLRMLHRTPMAYLWHAPDKECLLELLRSAAPASDDGDIPAIHARVGFVASDEEEATALRELAIEYLSGDEVGEEWSHPAGVFFRRQALPGLRIGALFAGQGSQYLNMGLEAALNNPAVAQVFDRANACFAGAAPRLAQVVFPPPVFDGALRKRQEADLRRTEYAQPAIGALSVGQFVYLSELGLVCNAFAGHSFGELTALWAAGSISDADYFRLAAARGRAMAPVAEGDSGTMAAVKASREQVTDILTAFPDLTICNHNAPEQVVVGGGTEDVKRLVKECGRRNVTARLLPVAAAFHTCHVAHAVDLFQPEVDAVCITTPTGPVYANSPGAFYGDDTGANARTLVQQLLEPVEFVAVLKGMRADGVTVFVEFGPKQVLTQFVRQTLGDEVCAIPTDAGPLGNSDVALKRAAVRLAVLGAPLSGINRYTEPPVAEPVTSSGMSVTISGAEYVPEQRRAAYEAALADGYRLEGALADSTGLKNKASTPTPGQMAPVITSTLPTTDPSATPVTLMEDTVLNPVDQHLAAHSQYLESQLRVGERVAEVLRQPLDPPTAEAVQAITRQSEAIGRAHARASEILATLAELETGSPRHATIRRSAPTWTPTTEHDRDADEVHGMAGLPERPVREFRLAPEAPLPTPPPEPTLQTAPLPASEAETEMVNGVARVELRSSLVEVIAEKTGYPVGMIDPAMDLETDLGVDSIKKVQVFAAIRDRVPGLPDIGPEMLGELRTVNQVVAVLTETGDVDPKAHEAAQTRRHTVELTRLPAIDTIEKPYCADPVVVLVDDGHVGGDALVTGLTAQGWTVRRARHASDIEALFIGRIDLCLSLAETERDWAGARRYLAETIMLARRAATVLDPTSSRAGFVTITRLDGGLGLHGHCGAAPSLVGGVSGVVKTLAGERPGLFCRSVDVALQLPGAEFVDAVLDEIRDAAIDTAEVGVDATCARWTVLPSRHGSAQQVSTVGPDPDREVLTLTSEDLVLVTGGARGITAHCVHALAGYTNARFLLLGRTELGAEPSWASGVADNELQSAAIVALSLDDNRPTPQHVARVRDDLLAQREVRKNLAMLGKRAAYLAVDIADAAAVDLALSEHRGRITGLVHGAGVLADARLADKTAAQVERVFRSKLDGLRHVLDAVDSPALQHLVLFTSVAGLLGNPGQADYAAANEALCRFAAGWKHAHPDTHVTAIDWSAWNGGMVTDDLRELFTTRGISLLDVEVGARAFVEQFTEDHASDLRVLIGDSVALGGQCVVPSLAFTARRDIGDAAADPVLQAHRIGAHPVFPATFGLGWLINTVERAHPGMCVVHVTNFQVHKGIVFDNAMCSGYQTHVEPGISHGDRIQVRATVRSQTDAGQLIPHYAATLELATAPQTAPRMEVLPFADGPEDGPEIYRHGTLFHGPRLQGLRRVLGRSSSRLVLLCRLADVAGTAYTGRLHSPVLADLLLQGPAVLGTDLLGDACLPLDIGAADYFAPLPDNEPFLLVVDDVCSTDATITTNATAATLHGEVLQRFTAITMVSTKDMTAKFREAVRSWHPGEGASGESVS